MPTGAGRSDTAANAASRANSALQAYSAAIAIDPKPANAHWKLLSDILDRKGGIGGAIQAVAEERLFNSENDFYDLCELGLLHWVIREHPRAARRAPSSRGGHPCECQKQREGPWFV